MMVSGLLLTSTAKGLSNNIEDGLQSTIKRKDVAKYFKPDFYISWFTA